MGNGKWYFPVDTWRNNNVIITSTDTTWQRHFDVLMTLLVLHVSAEFWPFNSRRPGDVWYIFKVKLTFEMLTVRGQQHSFLTHERVFLRKCQSFWDRKCFDLRGTHQLMARKPLPKSLLTNCQLTTGNKLGWYMNPNASIFFQENAFENDICKITAIVLRSHRVDSLSLGKCDNNFKSVLSEHMGQIQ